jgi:hypothetical protein
MKISQYLYILLILALYILNYFYFNIKVFTFTGIVLLLLVFLVIIVNFYVKYRDKNKGVVNNDFIFPEKVAKSMKTMDVGIQYEASIISIAFLMVGMILFDIYVIFFTGYETILKAFIVFNSCCGIVLMGSMLVTNYQQFISYKESMNIMNSFTDFSGGEIKPFGNKLVPQDNEIINKIMSNNYENERRLD